MSLASPVVIQATLIIPFLTLGIGHFFFRKTEFGKCVFYTIQLLFVAFNFFSLGYVTIRNIYTEYGFLAAILVDIVAVIFLLRCCVQKTK